MFEEPHCQRPVTTHLQSFSFASMGLFRVSGGASVGQTRGTNARISELTYYPLGLQQYEQMNATTPGQQTWLLNKVTVTVTK